jgi:proteasome assembly chaperone (PAC2) family protein
MADAGILIDRLPGLKDPVLIAGFDGWGNALNVSSGMAAYLARSLDGHEFGRLNSDLFYRFDENRAQVTIEGGLLKSISTPGGKFYAIHTGPGQSDLIILRADEPNLRWFQFVDELARLCQRTGVKTLISLGSMYDNVLHTDRIISAVVSVDELIERLIQKHIRLVDYQGPSAIHSIIQSELPKHDVSCISLWCHCPYYLQGTTHFGLLAHLADVLSFIGDFAVDSTNLELSWKQLEEQIQTLIDKNPELQNMIRELRKAKAKGISSELKAAANKDDKVINLKDFLDPK